jgi:hypothetical protein
MRRRLAGLARGANRAEQKGEWIKGDDCITAPPSKHPGRILHEWSARPSDELLKAHQ